MILFVPFLGWRLIQILPLINQEHCQIIKHGCRRGLDSKFNGLEHVNDVKWVLSNLPNTREKMRLKWAQADMAREECDH